jgi:hypothetical protein
VVAGEVGVQEEEMWSELTVAKEDVLSEICGSGESV